MAASIWCDLAGPIGPDTVRQVKIRLSGPLPFFIPFLQEGFKINGTIPKPFDSVKIGRGNASPYIFHQKTRQIGRVLLVNVRNKIGVAFLKVPIKDITLRIV
jgi:hypothetical protein